MNIIIIEMYEVKITLNINLSTEIIGKFISLYRCIAKKQHFIYPVGYQTAL